MAGADTVSTIVSGGDPLGFLLENHDLIADRLGELVDSGSGAPRMRNRQFERVVVPLTAHMHMEQATLYPELGKHEAGTSVIRLSIGHHRALEALVERMRLMDPEEPVWARTVEKLADGVFVYLAFERDILLPLIRRLIEPKRLPALAESMRQARQARTQQQSRVLAGIAPQRGPQAGPGAAHGREGRSARLQPRVHPS